MLEVTDLSVSYGAVKALSKASLHVAEGEIVALIGANGAGKSTLLNAISGIVSKAEGTLRMHGKRIDDRPAHKVVRAGVVQVPEGRQVFRDMTVLENLEMGGVLRSARENREKLAEVFAMFPRLEERRTQLAGLLSGGEQQMLAIGRALMARPQLLLLDEPSMGLAPLIVADIFKALSELNRATRQSILIVEQNARAALRLATRAYVLVNGRISRQGDAAALLSDEEIRAAFLGSVSKKARGVEAVKEQVLS